MFAFTTLKLALVAAIVIALAVIVVAIKRGCDGPKPPHTEVDGPFDVVSVESGASLTYTTGRRDRQRERNKTSLVLWGIATPAEGQPGCDASRAALSTAAGASITVQREGRRRNATEKEVYGNSGQCLQVEQLRAGWAWCAGDVPKEWAAIEKEAHKEKRGIWATVKSVDFRPCKCPECGGTGELPERPCPICKGTLKWPDGRPCKLCEGKGTWPAGPCPMCDGGGKLVEELRPRRIVPENVEGGL